MPKEPVFFTTYSSEDTQTKRKPMQNPKEWNCVMNLIPTNTGQFEEHFSRTNSGKPEAATHLNCKAAQVG
jgi:hypothetical protein